MSDYFEIVPDPQATHQLDELINSDPQYKDEPEAYEYILSRTPEEVGLEMGTPGGETYYVFRTAQRPNGPPPLWISYVVERDKHRVRILDIRQ